MSWLVSIFIMYFFLHPPKGILPQDGEDQLIIRTLNHLRHLESPG
jgi:hypothetical protein